MNERITQLAEQAGAAKLPGGELSFFDSASIEKFAELIVQECASQLIKWKDEPFPYDPEFGARLIKQHFGVNQ